MKTMIAFLLVGAFFASTSQASVSEQLMGLRRQENGITLRVHSGGCTHKYDFLVRKTESEGNTALEFYRLREDRCLAMYADGLEIFFTNDELGVNGSTPITILNSF